MQTARLNAIPLPNLGGLDPFNEIDAEMEDDEASKMNSYLPRTVLSGDRFLVVLNISSVLLSTFTLQHFISCSTPPLYCSFPSLLFSYLVAKVFCFCCHFPSLENKRQAPHL